MAAQMLRERLARRRVSISSAGLHAIDGRPADERARAVAREFGVSLDDHRAELLTAERVRDSDLILVMDALNEADVLGRFPEASTRVFLLGSWLPGTESAEREIADPYDGDERDVRRCYELLQCAIGNLITDLFS
jgi:protein-tyrosine phosphatase